VRLGALAERYFRDDPATAIFKLRQFAELLCQRIAASHALYQWDRDTFEETLRRLSFERIIPREIADVFHALRKAGNIAGHEAKGSHSDALSALKFARLLGIWFHRTYGRVSGFKAGAFIPPPEPVDVTAPLQEEIERLRRQVAATEDAVGLAQRRAEEHARARESVEQRLAREAKERAVWEKLAAESESKTLEIAARLAALQAAAEQAPRAESLEFIQRGEEASAKLDLDEADTRSPRSGYAVAWRLLEAHPARGLGCGFAGEAFEPAQDSVAIDGVAFDQPGGASGLLRRNQGGAGAAKRIEHDRAPPGAFCTKSSVVAQSRLPK
jgi:type I restriction enzyme R subunit